MSWTARAWSKIILISSGIKYNVYGLKNIKLDSNYIFAANHESALDIPLVFASLPLHLVALSKIELKWIPIFGWSMIAGGHFFVDRRNHKKSLKSLDVAKKSMAKNPRSIIIFPEGSRYSDGTVHSFKKGGLVLGVNLKMPIVPIAICGTKDIIINGKISKNNKTLELRIGKPINTIGLKYEDRNEFAEKVRSKVVELKENHALTA